MLYELKNHPHNRLRKLIESKTMGISLFSPMAVTKSTVKLNDG